MAKLYGSLCNRIEENKNYTGREIKEGDDITMYYWSDRHCYFITKVIDQKHIFVKEYEVIADREKVGGMGHQNWLYFKTKKEANHYMNTHMTPEELASFGTYDEDPKESSEQEWVFRYGKWNRVLHKDYLGNDLSKPRYEKLQPISFGVRSYYYDWEF